MFTFQTGDKTTSKKRRSVVLVLNVQTNSSQSIRGKTLLFLLSSGCIKSKEIQYKKNKIRDPVQRAKFSPQNKHFRGMKDNFTMTQVACFQPKIRGYIFSGESWYSIIHNFRKRVQPQELHSNFRKSLERNAVSFDFHSRNFGLNGSHFGFSKNIQWRSLYY